MANFRGLVLGWMDECAAEKPLSNDFFLSSEIRSDILCCLHLLKMSLITDTMTILGESAASLSIASRNGRNFTAKQNGCSI